MRKYLLIVLMLVLLIPATIRAQEDCEAITIAREIDALYNDFLIGRGEVDSEQMISAAEEFHAQMGDILLRCGSTSVSISNDLAGEFAGEGTEQDPYAFGQPGAASDGLSIRPIEFVRDESVYETLGIDPVMDTEYILVVVEVGCPADSLTECEATLQNFRLVGDSGTVYDTEFVMTYDESLDVQMPPGRLRTGGIPFQISPDETSFNLLYYPDTTLASEEEQTITYYRTENFVRIKATTQVVVRSGPGVQFPVISSISQGQEVVTDGRNDNGTWLRIEGGWVSADPVTVEVGNIMWLPVVEPEN